MFRADAMSLQLLVLLTIGIVLRMRHGKPAPHDAEYKTLRARYARGDISRTVYDRRRRELQQRARTRRTA